MYLNFCLANSKLLQSPDDTEAVVGEDVIFRCQTDFINTVEWRYKAVPSETSPFQIISKQKLINNLFKGRYEIISNAATGQYDLVIKNVQPQDAGRYTCGDIHDSNHAELTVFGKRSNNVSSTLNNFMAIITYMIVVKRSFKEES